MSNMSSSYITQLKMLPQKVLCIILFLLIWEIAPRTGMVDPNFLPPPSIVFSVLYELILSGVLYKHASISLERALTGLGIAAVTAIPVGFIAGWFKTFEKYIDPLMQTIRQLPNLALFPIFIIFFGIGETSKIAIIALASFWSIFLNTVSGVQNIDPLLIKSAKSMGISPVGMFLKVVLPASAHSIFIGLRYGATVSIMVLVAAEMIGGDAGLGFFLMNSAEKFQIPDMYATIIALTVIGVGINYVLIGVERIILKWKEEVIYS